MSTHVYERMAAYRSTAVVRAAPITLVSETGCMVRLLTGEEVRLRYPKDSAPEVGDLWVVHRDGDVTITRPLAFAAAYSEAAADDPQWARPASPAADAERDAAQDAEIRVLAHAIQTGVAYVMGWDSKETDAKHLRVGINMALVANAGLAELLIALRVCTMGEIKDYQIAALKREVESYEKTVAEHFGDARIKLG